MIVRKVFLIFLALLIFDCAGTARRTPPPMPLEPTVFNPLKSYLQKSYLELFEVAPNLHFTQQQIQQMRQYLQESEKYCAGVYRTKAMEYEQQLQKSQYDLMRVGNRIDEPQRREMHCNIQNLRTLRDQSRVLAQQGVAVAYDNRQAKLDLIEQWPAEYRRIEQSMNDGSYRNRRWANVQDIGYRQIAPDQKDDIDDGQKAILEMRRQQLLPPQIENAAVNDYVRNLAEKLARNSDLQVPVHVTVLNSKEINAFALPGGFLFVDRGLLENAADESEVAGVLGHEMAHVAARHGHKLLKRATIAEVIYSAVRIAGAMSGYSTLGYALSYGGAGLGLVMNLDLLGVNRDYELEADQLGIQYCWHAGYDPSGFIRFFDRMATKKGYATGSSWFRTHPPFYERMVKAKAELMYLPKKEYFTSQTSEFQNIQKEVEKIPLPPEEVMEQQPVYPVAENCPAPPQSAADQVCDLPEVPTQHQD